MALAQDALRREVFLVLFLAAAATFLLGTGFAVAGAATLRVRLVLRAWVVAFLLWASGAEARVLAVDRFWAGLDFVEPFAFAADGAFAEAAWALGLPWVARPEADTLAGVFEALPELALLEPAVLAAEADLREPAAFADEAFPGAAALAVEALFPEPVVLAGGGFAEAAALVLEAAFPEPVALTEGAFVEAVAFAVEAAFPEPVALAEGAFAAASALVLDVAFPEPVALTEGAFVEAVAFAVEAAFPEPVALAEGVFAAASALVLDVAFPEPVALAEGVFAEAVASDEGAFAEATVFAGGAAWFEPISAEATGFEPAPLEPAAVAAFVLAAPFAGTALAGGFVLPEAVVPFPSLTAGSSGSWVKYIRIGVR